MRVSLDRFDLEMRQLGYVKGTHYVTVERMAEGHNERLRSLAEELVRLKVDVILAAPTNAVAEAQRATSSIPIVFGFVSDPVGSGFATTLAHPGRNLTGVTNFVGDLTGKRFELTLPAKNVSLAEWFNASKENGNDEDDEGAIHARVQARGGAAGRGRAEYCCGSADVGGGPGGST